MKDRGWKIVLCMALTVGLWVHGNATASNTSSAGADAIVGEWLTEGGENQARVRVTRKGDRYRGEIVWLKEPHFSASDGVELNGQAKTDRRNPDPANHDRPIVGLQLLEGFRHRGENRWDGGTIYDPESGKIYKCKLTLSNDHDVLAVRGFIGVSFIGRTTTWHRAPSTMGTQR